MTTSHERPVLSVVVPFFNEEESVARLHQAVVAAVEELDLPFEIVMVDDGSRDNTFALARDIALRDSRVRVVKFRRNYGQTAAMAAGIEYAHGEIVVTIDGDLQNDPRDIEAFVAKIREGHDIVVGWRYQRQDKLITRKIPSRIANWLIGKVTGVPIRDNGCSLKAFRADLIKSIPLYSDMHRFIPAMASVAGPRIAEIKVRHHARQFGTSKYGLSRIYKVLLDLLVIKTIARFASRPTVWFTTLSLPFLVAGTGALGYALWMQWSPGQRSALPLAGAGLVMLMSALILWTGGIFGELVFKTGDTREQAYARLTQRLSTGADQES
jgi:glycosyltransferase involved in cell wall biosynthesis